VWDIRIESDAQVDTAAIIDTLDTLGLYVGASWSGIDTSSVENSLLLLSNDVGWVNVNRRGTVAYVEVRKKDIPDHQPHLTYSNIVAAYDGIIESINVKSGYAVVKVGDSVRAGDLLVSGILPDSLGGGIVGAEATVIAKRQDVISLAVPSVFEQYEYSSPLLSSFSLKIFNFSVNILNFSGNFATECDIIEKTTPIFIFDKKIPIEILSTYAIQKQSISISSTPEEMTRIASERLNSKMLELLANSTLISIKTTGGFFGDEYTLTSYVTHTLDIAKEVAIELS
jgi:similar to stage IV sporulation protein